MRRSTPCSCCSTSLARRAQRSWVGRSGQPWHGCSLGEALQPGRLSLGPRVDPTPRASSADGGRGPPGVPQDPGGTGRFGRSPSAATAPWPSRPAGRRSRGPRAGRTSDPARGPSGDPRGWRAPPPGLAASRAARRSRRRAEGGRVRRGPHPSGPSVAALPIAPHGSARPSRAAASTPRSPRDGIASAPGSRPRKALSRSSWRSRATTPRSARNCANEEFSRWCASSRV